MATETLTLTLPAELAAALRDAVAAGEYASPDEAAADALATRARREEDREEALALLRAKIRASRADPRHGLTSAQVKARLDASVANFERSADDEAA